MKKNFCSVIAVSISAAMLFTACSGSAGVATPSPAVTAPAAPVTVAPATATPATAAPAAVQTEAPNTAAAGEPGEYSLPLVTDGSVTISVAVHENSTQGFSYSSNLPVWQKLQDDTGVKIDWQVTPASDYNTVMQTRLAAGVDLPDFINIPGNTMKYISDGIIVPITEQLEKNGFYTKKLYEENPYIKAFVTAPDGDVYLFTSDVSGAAAADPYAYMIREDWLEKCNLSVPETLDDWYEMWKAFLENDANGNGLRDEIPFSNDNRLIGVTIFGNAYGLRLHRSSGWSVNGSGTVEYDYIKPEMKELLTWLNKSYSEDLIDKEFATQGFDVIMKKVSSNQSGGVFRALNGLSAFNKALEDAGVNGKYIAVAPPKLSADSTIPRYVEAYGPVSGAFGFTKDCKDLDTKFKFIDYIYASQAGNYAVTFGIEGKTYEMVNNKPVYTDFATNNPDGKTLNIVLRELGCSPTLPWVRSASGLWSYQPLASIAHDKDTSEAALMYQEYNISNFPQGTLLTESEQSVIGQYQTDIDTYRDEMITKFIMGTESLDNFDKYVQNINSMGLDKILEIRQAQYKRYMEAQQ